MKPSYAALLLALSQFALPVIAQAQVQALARLSNIDISLTDLAPGDGIAPSYTYSQWFAGYDQAETTIDHGATPGWSDGILHDSGVAPWTNHQLNFDSSLLPGHTGAHLAGETRRSGSSLDTLELAAASHALGDGGAWVQSNVTSNLYGMALSPWTALRVQFEVEVESSVSLQSPPEDAGYAGAIVRIDFTALHEFEDVNVSHLVYHERDGLSESGTAGTQFITIEFANSSDAVSHSVLSLMANAYSVAPAAPVPELPAYALLAAGAVLLAGVARRRQPTV